MSIQLMTTPVHEWQKYNTLIVDDEPAIVETLARDLKLEGLKVFKASGGEAALDLIDKEEIHVILSDQKMPGGLSGSELIAKAYDKNPSIVGIILSAYSDADHLLSAINDAHVYRYLLKPWDKEKLIECVKEALKLYHIRTLDPAGVEEQGYTQHLFTDAIDQFTNAENSCRQLALLINEAIHTLDSVSNLSTRMANNIKKLDISNQIADSQLSHAIMNFGRE